MYYVFIVLIFYFVGRHFDNGKLPITRFKVQVVAFLVCALKLYWMVHKYLLFQKFGVYFGIPIFWDILLLAMLLLVLFFISTYRELINKHFWGYDPEGK